MIVKETQAASGNRRTALIMNWISHIFYFFTIPVWYFIWIFSAMLFDSPGSEKQWFPIMLYSGISGYPLVAAGSVVAAWVLYAKGLFRRTHVLNAVPAVYILVVIVLALIFGDK